MVIAKPLEMSTNSIRAATFVYFQFNGYNLYLTQMLTNNTKLWMDP